MKDESWTQTDHISADDSSGSREDTHHSHNLRARIIQNSEETKAVGSKTKMVTTPKSTDHSAVVNKNDKIFSSLVYGGNKKNTIFSLQKKEELDDDPYKINVQKTSPHHNSDSQMTEYELQTLNRIDYSNDDQYSNDSNDEVQIDDDPQNQDDIPEIFKNSEIREKTHQIAKPRYMDSDEEGEGEGEGDFDFYN